MGSGGYRYNAGRPGHLGKVEHCLSLNVNRIKRLGVLKDGSAGSLTWTRKESGEERGSISYSTAHQVLELRFLFNGESVVQRLTVARTACNFGGTRPWLQCPCCWRRAGVLHLRWKRFACRACNQLAYVSQSEDECGRTWLRQHKIEDRLAPNWQRPKGMRRKTYSRLMAGIIACEERRDGLLSVYVARLFSDTV